MMMNIVFIIAFFAVAAFLHASFLVFAKSSRSQVRPKSWWLKFWKLHYVFNGILWLTLVGLIVRAQFLFPHHDYPLLLKIFGIACILLGTTLVARSVLLLGLDQAMGLRFFFPEKARRIKSDVYRFLHNPMYDGFLLLLLGLGLWLGVPADFYLALTSFFLLNIFLASVENYDLNVNPF